MEELVARKILDLEFSELLSFLRELKIKQPDLYDDFVDSLDEYTT